MIDKQTDDEIANPSLERRTFLKLAAVTGGIAAWEGATGLGGALAQQKKEAPFVPTGDAARIKVADPDFMHLYGQQRGYYLQNADWVKETIARLTWPKEGDKVPELSVLLPNESPDRIAAFRKYAKDAEQVGLAYQLHQVSQARWLEAIVTHRHGDVQVHPAVARAERIDPSEWLISRAYGKDRRNYGEWANIEYDRLIDEQSALAEFGPRLKVVQAAQKVIADDLYITTLGWGPGIMEPYNAERWDGVQKVTGFGICSFDMFHTFLSLKPKSAGRRRVVVGCTSLVETLNIIQAANRFRAVGRMIYDRFAYLDKDLKVIPWAMESWTRLNDKEFIIKLRDGMKFHDGKPVTVHDVKFSLDFLVRYDRGFFWTANQYLASAEIASESERTLKLVFKQAYGQFESYFLLLNVILPKHIWENILVEQRVGDDPRALRFEKPIGSGPFMCGRYQQDTQLQLLTNKSHFSKPTIDEILILVVPSIDGILGRLQAQEIDFAEQVDFTPSQIDSIKGEPHIRIEQTTDINWLHAVKRISWLPWRDYEFRRAWTHTIDREYLVKVVWEGSGRVPKSNTFLVEGNPWHAPGLPAAAPFDLKKAREILGDAGYSWASDGRLVYPKPDNKAWRERVEKVCAAPYTWGGLKMIS